MNDIFNNFIDDFTKSFISDNRYTYILEGVKNTLVIYLFALIIGFFIGLIIVNIKMYHNETKKLKILNFISNLYISIIRGTPILLQLMIIYYIIFRSIDINIILVGIIAFGINSGAYIAEILRAGFESVEQGQKESAYALGLNYFQTMKNIIIPQGLRNALPTLGNEAITLIKETSVAGFIGIIDLTKASDIIASRTYDYFFPLTMIALIYLLLTYIISKIVKFIEKRVTIC